MISLQPKSPDRNRPSVRPWSIFAVAHAYGAGSTCCSTTPRWRTFNWLEDIHGRRMEAAISGKKSDLVFLPHGVAAWPPPEGQPRASS